MHELIAFFRLHSKWFVFAFYAVVSCMLLVSNNPYQQHVYLTSANAVASGVYGSGYEITSYFNLRDINNDLNARNAALQSEVVNLHERLDRLQEAHYTDTMRVDSTMSHFSFVVAHVINNSISRPFNYLTINRGSDDGIKTELGVIDQNGVVGIVSNVGAHNSRVISLLNPNFRLSCRVKGSNGFGSLVWPGGDPSVALLEELPRHTVYKVGDTIVTSGYSAVFPAGIPVGKIIGNKGSRKDNFFTLRVKLFADFSTLSTVQVVINNHRDELKALEAGEKDDENKGY